MSRSPSLLSRRDWLRCGALGIGASLSGWFPALAEDALSQPQRKRSCILLWMPGGPAQTDLFDMKPGHKNGGEFKPIDTSAPGVQISEHLPKLARQMEHIALIRSMSTKEGDHGRATYHLRTGYRPQGPVQYPTFGALAAQEFGPTQNDLPPYVSILPNRLLSPSAFGPGFLGPSWAPLVVGGQSGFSRRANAEENPFGQPLEIRNIRSPEGVGDSVVDIRFDLLKEMDDEFRRERPTSGVESHRTAYDQALKMMRSESTKAFRVEEEATELRERYGRTRFGQACLMARRLVERGVPFIEVALNGANDQGIGWDTHGDNFNQIKMLSGILDPAWSSLIEDLKERGLLDSTLIVWMGEFGRTPVINPQGGRDHFPNAWTTALCGGGIRGGQFYGATSEGGDTVKDNPVAVSQFLATVCGALGIDHTKQNISNAGRPIRIVEPEAEPIRSVLA
jgi:hypothetical protein